MIKYKFVWRQLDLQVLSIFSEKPFTHGIRYRIPSLSGSCSASCCGWECYVSFRIESITFTVKTFPWKVSCRCWISCWLVESYVRKCCMLCLWDTTPHQAKTLVSFSDYFSHTERKNSLVNRLFCFCSKLCNHLWWSNRACDIMMYLKQQSCTAGAHVEWKSSCELFRCKACSAEVPHVKEWKSLESQTSDDMRVLICILSSNSWYQLYHRGFHFLVTVLLFASSRLIELG